MYDNECLICFEILNTKDIAILSCNHVIHYQCIQNWINIKNNMSEICPLCNNRGEIVNIIENKPKKKKKKIRSKEDNSKLSFMCCNIL